MGEKKQITKKDVLEVVVGASTLVSVILQATTGVPKPMTPEQITYITGSNENIVLVLDKDEIDMIKGIKLGKIKPDEVNEIADRSSKLLSQLGLSEAETLTPFHKYYNDSTIITNDSIKDNYSHLKELKYKVIADLFEENADKVKYILKNKAKIK